MMPEVEKGVEQPTPMGNGRLIYVAGPYRNKNEEEKRENIWHAIKVAVSLWEAGFFVICPHCNTANFEFYTSLPEDRWLEGGLEMVRRSDAIFMMKGWETSLGSKRELEVALEKGLGIYYETRV